MANLTPVEKETIRGGATNAVAHVSEAEDEGLLSMIKEGRAANKAFKSLPEPLRDAVLGDFNTPDDYQWPATDSVEAYLAAALAVIERSAPTLVDQYKQVVLQACEDVAAAAKGVSSNEQRALAEVRAALGL